MQASAGSLATVTAQVFDHAPHARLQLFQGLLDIGVTARLLAAQARRCELRRVTGGLNLEGQRPLVGRETQLEEDLGVE